MIHQENKIPNALFFIYIYYSLTILFTYTHFHVYLGVFI